MKYTIFYSWQSDLPNNTNRRFIEEAINNAIREIQKTEEYELIPSLDRDTVGIPGAPNISQTILEKIKTSDAFIADISLVTGDKNAGKRLSPNPNVLIELGYAIALIGWERIILVCNEEYGAGEDLPFDIQQHRRLVYSVNSEDNNKATVRKELTSRLRRLLSELLEKGKLPPVTKSPILSVRWNYWANIEDTYEATGIETENSDICHFVLLC